MTRPPALKADSEATVDTCMASTSRASSQRTGYSSLWTFHHDKTSNVF
uniref:Uncharacterized protein n=1 Tax=Arundo donax TaxID=35708 RepID=A0A0A9H9G4_ARUDO